MASNLLDLSVRKRATRKTLHRVFPENFDCTQTREAHQLDRMQSLCILCSRNLIAFSLSPLLHPMYNHFFIVCLRCISSCITSMLRIPSSSSLMYIRRNLTTSPATSVISPASGFIARADLSCDMRARVAAEYITYTP